MVKKRQKKNLKKLGKKAEKLLTRLKSRFPELVQNSSIKDWTEVLVMSGLAIAGYEKFKTLRGALWGPVSFKLATAPGGTPPVAQVAGVASLAVLGLCLGADAEGGYQLAPVGPNQEFTMTFGEPCPEGYFCVGNYFGFNYCVRKAPSGVPEPHAPKGRVG